ncbi:hypothetical protein [Flavobacterium sp.]
MEQLLFYFTLMAIGTQIEEIREIFKNSCVAWWNADGTDAFITLQLQEKKT